jgi:hypothetical protein
MSGLRVRVEVSYDMPFVTDLGDWAGSAATHHAEAAAGPRLRLCDAGGWSAAEHREVTVDLYGPLNPRQVAVLRWIAEGCPDGVMTGSTYKMTAVAEASAPREDGRAGRRSIAARQRVSGTNSEITSDRRRQPVRYRVMVSRVQVAERYVRAVDEEDAARKVQEELDRPYSFLGGWRTVDTDLDVVEAESPLQRAPGPLSEDGPTLLSLKQAAAHLGISYGACGNLCGPARSTTSRSAPVVTSVEMGSRRLSRPTPAEEAADRAVVVDCRAGVTAPAAEAGCLCGSNGSDGGPEEPRTCRVPTPPACVRKCVRFAYACVEVRPVRCRLEASG